eukprot:CAMPEP_0176463384 /NCGR_PEP_ID=MMETSP0127-20121128/35849_1 /TAXON_ID=938130 /ORGANISM="Platyophrya macrostoma, Strain WH" /LENGTH=600 /DNA_ID=CAMNT_0017855519 /DNA_START=38 /DNA_END=1840 /DNA_ORIENTATION=+
MNQRDSLGEHNHQSNQSLSNFFKSLGNCCCGDRNPNGGDNQNPLDQSWATEYYYEYPADSNPYDQNRPISNKPEKQRQGRRDRSPREREVTGKGTAFYEDTEDDSRSASSKISRKNIGRNKGSTSKEKSKSKSTSKGRNPWQPEEDEALKKYIKQYGKRWSVISRLMGGTRTGKQIRDRYLNKLDPTIHEKEWTTYEDEMLIKYWQQLGNKWAEIAKYLEGRTESMVKNRYYSYIAKKRIGPGGVIIPDDTTLSMESSDGSGSNPILVGQPRGRTSDPQNFMGESFNNGYQNHQQFQQQPQQGQGYAQYNMGSQGSQGNYQRPSLNSQFEYPQAYAQDDGMGSFPNRISNGTENGYTNMNQIPLLPGVDLVMNRYSDPNYLNRRSDPSFLGGLDKVLSNNSQLRNEIQRSLGNSGNSTDNRALELLNLYNNYHPQRIIEEEHDGRSDFFPQGGDPYAFAHSGRSSRDFREWKQQATKSDDQQSNHHSTYSDGIMRRFGPKRDDETSMSSPTNNDMEIEDQLDRLAGMLDSRTVSYVSKNSGSLTDISLDEAKIAAEKAHKMNVLMKRRQALEMLLAKTQIEMQTTEPLLISPFDSAKNQF